MTSSNTTLKILNNFAIDKPNLDLSNYIILPPSYLKNIENCETPYYFKITNNSNSLSTYVGVKEFEAQEGWVIIPLWICQNLGLNNQEEVDVKLVKDIILEGKSVTFKPLEKEFCELPHYDKCLEMALSEMCLLVKGEEIEVEIYGIKYHLCVKEIDKIWPDLDKINTDNFNPLDNVILIKTLDGMKLEVNFINEQVEEVEEVIDINDSKVIDNNKPKGRKLSDNTAFSELSKEELRAKRLKRFEKKK
jgi:hypothetical protein